MTILSGAAIQVEVARLKLQNTVSFVARHSRCRVLQRVDASARTETQALCLNSCEAVRSGAMFL